MIMTYPPPTHTHQDTNNRVAPPPLLLQVCFLLFSAYLVFMMQTGFAMVSEAALRVETAHLLVAHARLHARSAWTRVRCRQR